MSTVKRVANPSAVRKTRMARMTELKGETQGLLRGRARCVHTSMRSTVCRGKPERRLNLSLAGAGRQSANSWLRSSTSSRTCAAGPAWRTRAFFKDIAPVGERQRELEPCPASRMVRRSRLRRSTCSGPPGLVKTDMTRQSLPIIEGACKRRNAMKRLAHGLSEDLAEVNR